MGSALRELRRDRLYETHGTYGSYLLVPTVPFARAAQVVFGLDAFLRPIASRLSQPNERPRQLGPQNRGVSEAGLGRYLILRFCEQ